MAYRISSLGNYIVCSISQKGTGNRPLACFRCRGCSQNGRAFHDDHDGSGFSGTAKRRGIDLGDVITIGNARIAGISEIRDRNCRRRNIVDYNIVGAGRGQRGIVRGVVGHARCQTGNHRPVTRHPVDLQVVIHMIAAVGNYYGAGSGRSAERHIGGGEIAHRFAENDRKVQGRTISRICLGNRLIYRYRRRYDVEVADINHIHPIIGRKISLIGKHA